MKQSRLKKLSRPFNPTLLVVTERKGTMVTAQRGDGSKVTRNASMLGRRLSKRVKLVVRAATTSYPSTGREGEIMLHQPKPRISRPKLSVRLQRSLIDEI